MKKSEDGITLVALVVTIIILLIISGVGITVLTQTGLLEKTKEAKKITENATEEENSTLGKYENTINQLTSSRNSDSNIKVESLINKTDELYNKSDSGYIFNTPTSYSNITSNNNIKLNNSIENYNYIIFEFDSFYTINTSKVKWYTNPTTKIISTETIKKIYTEFFGWEYGNYIILPNYLGDASNRISISFKDSNNMYVWASFSTTSQLTKLRITDIKGIKY